MDFLQKFVDGQIIPPQHDLAKEILSLEEQRVELTNKLTAIQQQSLVKRTMYRKYIPTCDHVFQLQGGNKSKFCILCYSSQKSS